MDRFPSDSNLSTVQQTTPLTSTKTRCVVAMFNETDSTHQWSYFELSDLVHQSNHFVIYRATLLPPPASQQEQKCGARSLLLKFISQAQKNNKCESIDCSSVHCEYAHVNSLLHDYEIGRHLDDSSSSSLTQPYIAHYTNFLTLRLLTAEEMSRHVQKFNVENLFGSRALQVWIEVDERHNRTTTDNPKYNANTRMECIVMDDFNPTDSMDHIISHQATALSQLDCFLNISIQLVKALKGIHQKNVFYKQLMPSNISVVVVPGGDSSTSHLFEVKLIDFSYASLDNGSLFYTRCEGCSRSISYLSYMAPEQTGKMNCRLTDYRADFYALGMIMYELLCGKTPFAGLNTRELIQSQLTEMPVAPHLLRSVIPITLSNIIMKLVSKKPEDRYQSSVGVLEDLQQCQNQLNETGSIANFLIAAHDYPERFIIPLRLYDREEELDVLAKTFDKVRKGGTEIVSVRGKSGLGKTFLINEFQSSINTSNEYFIFGKYDQMSNNIAYSGITEAFRMLVRMILSEPQDILNMWKCSILSALGSNGQLMIDLIPDLENLIGLQPPIPMVGPLETRNRYEMLFCNFVKVFLEKRTLILFLDDLQWVDVASIRLIETLFRDPEIKNLMFVGAYRDKGLTSSHPAMIFFEKMDDLGVSIQKIELHPLKYDNVVEWIQETLSSEGERAAQLARLIYDRTDGNPYFVKIVLQTLYDQHFIFRNNNTWEYDLNTLLENCDRKFDILSLVLCKINRLTGSARQMLNIACCLGSSFPFFLLRKATERSENQIIEDLRAVFSLGLAFIMDDYFHFRHDKVQEAINYELTDEERRNLSLEIGRKLKGHEELNDNTEYLFVIVDHMNKGRQILFDMKESKQRTSHLIDLVRYNRIAGRKANNSIAYTSALNYYVSGIDCFHHISSDIDYLWTQHHEIAFSLFLEYSEVLYLLGDLKHSDKIANLLLQRAVSPCERVDVYTQRIIQKTISHDVKKAIKLSKLALKEFGVVLADPEAEYIRQAQEIEQYIEQQKQANHEKYEREGFVSLLLENLVVATDKRICCLSKVLSVAIVPCYLADPCLYKTIGALATNISLKHGTTVASPRFFTWFASTLSMSENRNKKLLAKELGLLSLELSKKETPENRVNKCKVIIIYASLINDWFHPIIQGEKLCWEGFKAGLETGDLVFAGYLKIHILTSMFLRGEKIDTIIPELHRCLAFGKNIKHQLLTDVAMCFQFIFLYLLGKRYENMELQEQEIKYMNEMKERENFSTLFLWSVNKAMVLFLCDPTQYEKALPYLQEAEECLIYSPFQIYRVQYYFVDSLVTVGILRKLDRTKRPQKFQELLDKLNNTIDHIHTWSLDSPNVVHKYWLLVAERDRVSGEVDPYDICDKYDQAIHIALDNGFLHEYALANELSFHFWLSLKKEHIGKVYLAKAYKAYLNWGATRKADSIASQYPDVMDSNSALSQSERNLNSDTSRGRRDSEQLFEPVDYSLDLENVIISSHIISSTIDMGQLLFNIMKITIETSGAQMGAVIIDDCVEAEYLPSGLLFDSANIRTQCSIPISAWNNGCRAIVSYVADTKETVVLKNAVCSQYESDDYIAVHHCKSILCLPVTQQTELKAIIYVENNLTIDAFSEQRVQVLNILASQMAISLENSKFFLAQLQVAEIQRSRAQEAESYRRKQEDFIDRICHEIRNPLNGIFGNLELLSSSTETIRNRLENLTVSDPSGLRNQLQDMIDILGSIENCVKHQKVITDDVLTLSKLEASQVRLNIQPFRLNELVTSALRMYDSEIKNKQLKLNTNLLNNDVTLCGDSSRITQVITNLFSNAVKFASQSKDKKGEIDVTVSLSPANTTEENQVVIRISIMDNGVGMTQRETKHIFNRFEQATQRSSSEYGGAGLGLFISRNLVELMGGAITVESEKHRFTKFSFTIKCTMCENQQPPQVSHAPTSEHIPQTTPQLIDQETLKSKLKILIVEDNVINQKVLVRMLRQEGHECFIANNGVEALQMFDKQQLDFIFMDVVMPIMDGIEATRKIREIETQRKDCSPIPIIGVSGNARKEHEEKAMAVGFTDYLVKPVQKAEVLRTLSLVNKNHSSSS